MNKPQKISPEIWKSLSKSQKRAARKKLAAEKFHAAVLAADRRDAEFVARHTGSFSQKTGDMKMFKLTPEERASIRLVDSLKKAVSQNNAHNAALMLAASLENSVFEPAVRRKSAANQRLVKGECSNLWEQSEAVSAVESANAEMSEKFESVKGIFGFQAIFDGLNANYSKALKTAGDARLAYDESVKGGNKPDIAKAEKYLSGCQKDLECAKARLEEFSNRQAVKL